MIVEKPRPSFTNSNLSPQQQRTIHVSIELLAPCLRLFESHHTLKGLVESPVVSMRQNSFGVGEVLIGVRMQSCRNDLLQIRTRRSQCLPRGSVPGVDAQKKVVHPSSLSMLI